MCNTNYYLNENFTNANNNSDNKFVLYYADWCGHCKTVLPIWEQLSNKYKDSSIIKIDKITLLILYFFFVKFMK